MLKRILCLSLCLVLLLNGLLYVSATEPEALQIRTAEEFLTFAENCRLDSYSLGLSVVLEADLDLTGTAFAPIPIFSGSFDGAGHTITVELTPEGSAQGLFRYLTETAQVENLTVKGRIEPIGSRNQIGSIAGVNAGTLKNCHFSGSLSGSDYVGGLVGVNTLTGTLENCTSEGELHGDHFVGGIAGENLGVITGCRNLAQINTTPQQNSVDISDITMDSLLNTESAGIATDIGGITGASTGVIRDCENQGDVGYPQIGYNIGGIAGTQSGYITGCQNHGSIQGRKEVGGIVGQMEPALLLEFGRDTLQILEGQLGELSAAADRATTNAQTNSKELTGQMALLQDQAETARQALDVLLSPPQDPDALLAAQNALSSALEAMPKTLQNITAAIESTTGSMARDLGDVYGKIGAMQQTLNSATDTLGGSLEDLSDEDTEEDLIGKVSLSQNFGSILADMNAGGIAGAVAPENDIDALSDWQQTGDPSLNFSGQVRAVILSCENSGSITAKKQNAGGIAGWQSLGLVKSCINTGSLDSEKATNVGGIAGSSTGYIRSCYAKCQIRSALCAGGIAGSGNVVTDCLSLTQITGAEQLGAVLGKLPQDGQITGNHYLATTHDMGAIDGISYGAMATPVDLETFLALEALPEQFKTVTVSFLFSDGTRTDLQIPLGGSLSREQIPALPQVSGTDGHWEGLTEADLDHILFDLQFIGVYTPYRTTLESQFTQDGKPLVLAEGHYDHEGAVTVLSSDSRPPLKNRQLHTGSWTIQATEGTQTLRLYAPAEGDLKLLALENGSWNALSYRRDGSYLVFACHQPEITVALVQLPGLGIWPYVIAAALLLSAAAVTIVILQKKKRSA